MKWRTCASELGRPFGDCRPHRREMKRAYMRDAGDTISGGGHARRSREIRMREIAGDGTRYNLRGWPRPEITGDTARKIGGIRMRGKSAPRANNHVRPGCLCCHYNGCAHATRQFAEKSRAGDARKGEASSPRRATNQAVRRPRPHRGGGGMTASACLRGTTCHCAETDQCVW